MFLQTIFLQKQFIQSAIEAIIINFVSRNTEGFETADLQEAKALLEELSITEQI